MGPQQVGGKEAKKVGSAIFWEVVVFRSGVVEGAYPVMGKQIRARYEAGKVPNCQIG